jgi:hypothetical protein
MPAAVLTLGDSHGAVFRHPTFADRFPAVAWETVVVPGATASGLDNPNDSRTQAYPIFRRALDTTAARRVVVTLGEVDTGFVIWYRAAKHRESVFTMLDRAVAAYADFLAGIVGTFDVLVLSAALPTIPDEVSWGAVANLRREVRSSQRARTALTLEFNRRMRDAALARGASYLMLDDASLGHDGLVRSELLNPDPRDHHYAPERYAALIADAIGPFLDRPSPSEPIQP